MRHSTCVLAIVSGFIALAGVEVAVAGNESASEKGYIYTYPSKVPADYVFYRAGKEAPLQEEPLVSMADVRNFFTRKTLLDPSAPIPAEDAVELKLRIRELAQQLIDHAEAPISDQYRVIVTTFVNLNHLYKTSGLGRILGEQMISEFQRAGIEVIDVRMTPAIQIVEGYGEYALSRDMAQLSYVHDAQAVVVGTYTVSDGQIMINARLLHQGDGAVLSSGSIVIAENRLVHGFMQDEAVPPRQCTPVRLHDLSEIKPEK